MKASLPPLPDTGLDRPMWNLNSNDIFSVASTKIARTQNNQVEYDDDGVIYNNLWKPTIPKRWKFFLWTLLRECINTMDMLQRRLPTWNINPSWCIICKAAEEDRHHLFSLCPLSKNLWKKVEEVLDKPLPHTNPSVLCKEPFKAKGK